MQEPEDGAGPVRSWNFAEGGQKWLHTGWDIPALSQRSPTPRVDHKTPRISAGFHVYNFLVNGVGEIGQGRLGVDVEVSPQDDCIYDIEPDMYLPCCQIPDSCSRAYNAR